MKDDILRILADICGDEIVFQDENINLRDEMLMDSIDYVSLLLDFEAQLGITISPTECTMSDLETPAKIVQVVERKSMGL